MVNEAQPSCTSEEEPTGPISPAETSDDGRDDEAHGDEEVNVPLVDENGIGKSQRRIERDRGERDEPYVAT